MEQLILYGGGGYLSKHINDYAGCKVACIVDKNKKKIGGQIFGYNVLCIDEALTKYPDAKIAVTVDLPLRWEVFHYLKNRGDVDISRVIDYVPVEHRLSCDELENNVNISNSLLVIFSCCGGKLLYNNDSR